MTDKPEQPSLAALDLAALKVVMLRELNDTGATYRQCLDMLESQAARIAELEAMWSTPLFELIESKAARIAELEGALAGIAVAARQVLAGTITPKEKT